MPFANQVLNNGGFVILHSFCTRCLKLVKMRVGNTSNLTRCILSCSSCQSTSSALSPTHTVETCSSMSQKVGSVTIEESPAGAAVQCQTDGLYMFSGVSGRPDEAYPTTLYYPDTSGPLGGPSGANFTANCHRMPALYRLPTPLHFTYS